MKDTSLETEDRQAVVTPTLWQENHGNLLIGFVVAILVIGASILAYRQNRFVPPRFPDSSAIQTVEAKSDVVDEGKSVTISVRGAASNSGMMMIAIYGASGSFNQAEEALILQALPVKDRGAKWAVPHASLPKKLAVAAYHDENSDGELNRNGFGLPTELYGYSRGARGITGPPSFEQAVIDRPEVGQTIEVEVR